MEIVLPYYQKISKSNGKENSLPIHMLFDMKPKYIKTMCRKKLTSHRKVNEFKFSQLCNDCIMEISKLNPAMM